jgi:myo-inositol-1(or 4)-monophosphatase
MLRCRMEVTMSHDAIQLAAIARRGATASRALLAANFGAATVTSQIGRDIKLGEDRASEDLIVAALRAGSGLPILTEESGWLGAPATGEALYWIVDPIDGSYNYHQGVPLCGTAVALCRGMRPVLGCIDDFSRGETFWGGPEIGLHLNDVPLTLPPFVRGSLATGFPVRGDFTAEGMAQVTAEFARWKKVRMIGTAALAMAWTACGRFDGYVERGTRWWDVAAGIALIEAGGGTVRVVGDDPLATLDVFAERGGGQAGAPDPLTDRAA